MMTKSRLASTSQPRNQHTEEAFEAQRLTTTQNEGLDNEIRTLRSIYAGELDAFDAARQLKRVIDNLDVLRNLLIEQIL